MKKKLMLFLSVIILSCLVLSPVNAQSKMENKILRGDEFKKFEIESKKILTDNTKILNDITLNNQKIISGKISVRFIFIKADCDKNIQSVYFIYVE